MFFELIKLFFLPNADKKWEDEVLRDLKDLQEFEVVNKDCNDIKSTFDEELAKDLAEMKWKSTSKALRI